MQDVDDRAGPTASCQPQAASHPGAGRRLRCSWPWRRGSGIELNLGLMPTLVSGKQRAAPYGAAGAMARLSAFAVPLRAPLFSNVGGEHTYVVSDEGHRWPCFGSADSGRQICTGNGDLALVRCLARSDGRAGISYGWTGICHQTANRLLWPAGILVSQAEAYKFSSTLFGHHGLGRWRERELCRQLLGPGRWSPKGVHAP
jgi:hypothetical protein